MANSRGAVLTTRTHNQEVERAVQTVIAAAQALRPWTAQFDEAVTAAMAGIAEHQAQRAKLTTRELLQAALDRVVRAEGLCAQQKGRHG